MESNLPYIVDIVDWASASESFREIIEEECIVVQKATNHKDGWRKFTIGEVADIVGGGTPSTKKPENFDGNIPWLTPKDLSGHHDRYIDRGRRNLSQAGLENSSAKLVPARSVLLSTRAPIGYVALAKNPISTNQGFRNLLVKKGFSPEFLYYWLTQNTEELKRRASGSTFSELSGSALKNIELHLPSLPTQQTIASILGALDDKIELNRKMSETLEQMAQALFKSWFVDFDPVRAKMEGRWRRGESLPGLPADLWELFPNSMMKSEMGKLPEGWNATPLIELIEINPKRFLQQGEIAPYLNMANMPTIGHVPHTITNRPFSSGVKFTNGDTLVARITPCLENGKTAYVDFLSNGEIGWGSTEYIVMHPKPPLPSEFAYCLSRSASFRKFAIQNMTGTSGRQRVSLKALSQFMLPSPTRHVAENFGGKVQLLLERASKAIQVSRTLTTLRDALLPRLVSGNLRVI
ncbi:MAG: restriction endonuclease subunit S [Candidatus Dadabacteria bacterium]|nr:restriction endonuclease subunit S [Candidatus Dadabacteria bacterium]